MQTRKPYGANSRVPNGSATVEVQALTRQFGRFTAVDALNLTVQSGEIFGLLGPNGAGKSTVIKMLTTLLPPSSGQAAVSGLNLVHQAAAVRRIIGYVPQALSADGGLTGYENLLISAKLYNIPREQRAHRIRDMLTLMGLEAAAHRMVRQYSGGMIRKLEIAQAILHRPHVLFLDEPTVGLDPLARSQVWELVMQLQANYGTTVILTTHFLEEADHLCDRVTIMHQGKAVVTGTPTELKASLGQSEHQPETTLDDVFIHYTGDQLMSGTNYYETSKLRRTAQRLG